tara:strand:+ start:202 stop:375 length:174 start_codon:yes stop_codon:yes gene_type:complete
MQFLSNQLGLYQAIKTTTLPSPRIVDLWHKFQNKNNTTYCESYFKTRVYVKWKVILD